MMQRSLFGLSGHLEWSSGHGDPLEVLEATVDFECFCGWLVERLCRSDGSKSEYPSFAPVSMFKTLILQAQHNLGDARMEFIIRDSLSPECVSWASISAGPCQMRTRSPAIPQQIDRDRHADAVDEGFWLVIAEEGLHPDVAGQIIDASLVPAPKQRNTDGEKEAIKVGKTASEIWSNEPNKATQKDADERWTLKNCRQDPVSAGRHATTSNRAACVWLRERSDLGFAGGWVDAVTIDDDAEHLLRGLCRQCVPVTEIEKWLASKIFVSRIHPRKSTGKPMPKNIALTNAGKSAIRAAAEHVFAHQKNRFGLFIRTICLARAEAKLTLTDIAYNFNRLIFHERARTMGCDSV